METNNAMPNNLITSSPHNLIPKVIHYCWFGRGEMPELVQNCIASWHTHMPDWEYRLWSEDTIAQVLCQPTPSPSLKGGEFGLAEDRYEESTIDISGRSVRIWRYAAHRGLLLPTAG